ncbi:class II fructose-bisphosphate aldolase [Streptomyces sp. M19]
MTDPGQAADFVARTGVDALAVAVGNVHGFAPDAHLDLERLAALQAAVPVPLVLHGASGLPEEEVRRAIGLGVAKVNVNAELRRAYLNAVAENLPTALPRTTPSACGGPGARPCGAAPSTASARSSNPDRPAPVQRHSVVLRRGPRSHLGPLGVRRGVLPTGRDDGRCDGHGDPARRMRPHGF